MAWLEAAREEDDEALSRLLEAVRPQVHAYLRSRLRSQPGTDSLSEELTQSVLLRLVRSIGGCRAEAPAQFRAWVRTIARRAAVDWYRKRQPELDRRARGHLSDCREERLRGIRSESGVLRDEEDVAPERRVLGRLLWEAQSVLSEGTRTVIRRRLLFGDTWEAAGAAIDTSAGGAKRRWQRAQVRLQKEVLERARELPRPLREEVLRRLDQGE